MYSIDNGSVTTARDVAGFDFDPSIGSGFTMTARGWVKSDIVEGFVRDEARRLATMEPLEVEFA
jgi:hypothetical protein